MNVYNYIAESNPYFAKGICQKYGYQTTNIRSKSDLGQCLKLLVQKHGEGAFQDIMQSHPDKDLILEMFAKKETFSNMDGNSNGCSCRNCNQKSKDHYSNADGDAKKPIDTTIMSIGLLSVSLILAVAIISKN